MKIKFFDKKLIDTLVAFTVVATIVTIIYVLIPASQFAHV